jgi:hypothetical protein
MPAVAQMLSGCIVELGYRAYNFQELHKQIPVATGIEDPFPAILSNFLVS